MSFLKASLLIASLSLILSACENDPVPSATPSAFSGKAQRPIENPVTPPPTFRR